MFKKQLLIILFIFWAQESSCFMNILADIFAKVWKFTEFVNHIDFTKGTVMDVISIFKDDDNSAEVIRELKGINNTLNNLKVYTVEQFDYIKLLILRLPDELAIKSKITNLAKFIRLTNKLWDDLMSCMEHNATKKLSHDLANDIKEELRLPLLEFRSTLAPASEDIDSSINGIFTLIVNNDHEKRDTLCDQGRTSHDKIVSLFQIAVATEVKTHILLFVAQSILFPEDIAWRVQLEKDFKKQFRRFTDTLAASLKIKKLPYIRSCEPDVWRLDDNCYGFNGYLQQTIYYSPSGLRGLGCMYGCRDHIGPLPTARDYPNYPMVAVNRHAECENAPIQCVNLTGTMRYHFVCPWNEGPYRIRFIRDGEEYFGMDKEAIAALAENNTSKCPTWDIDMEIRKDLVEAYPNRFTCQCPGSKMKLVRQMATSKLGHNYVIVGVRIHKVDDYIYIQIAEGKLEENGYISNYSWAPSTRIAEWSWQGKFEFGIIKKDEDAFFFGDVQLPPGHVLTKIGFMPWEKDTVHGTAVAIGGLLLNYGTGQFNRTEMSELSVQRGTHRELKFPLKTPINKNKTSSEQMSPKSDGYTHVHFQRSDLSDDYGQTTLPLFDGLAVLTKPLSPIGGVGLYYKANREDYAGFLSLRLYPLNYTYFMDTFRNSINVNAISNLDD